MRAQDPVCGRSIDVAEVVAAVLRGHLEPLAADGQPFHASARELLALIALREGDRAGARELYTKIADDREAPSGLHARAAQMLAALKE